MTKFELTSPTKEQILKAREFARQCVKTNKDEYSRRNQDDFNKLKLDIENGKLAEMLVYDFFAAKGKKVSPIDFAIYGKEKKSFAADLTTEENGLIRNIHVKCHQPNEQFEISWLFQPNDPVVLKPEPNDYFAFVVLYTLTPYKDQFGQEHMKSTNGVYTYFVKASSMLGLYRPPQKQYLNKKVIYESNIVN